MSEKAGKTNAAKTVQTKSRKRTVMPPIPKTLKSYRHSALDAESVGV